MQLRELSDTFDTLLNSYNTQAQFGEQASRQEIALDEYEKSVLLTQAQDIVVKSYFDKTLNYQGQGFDDTPRRQVDFSSLIKIAEQGPIEGDTTTFDPRGVVFEMPKSEDGRDTTDVLFVLNEQLRVKTSSTPSYWHYEGFIPQGWQFPDQEGGIDYIPTYTKLIDGQPIGATYSSVEEAEMAGWNWIEGKDFYKNYVIVPINFKEYDREMSKPFAQPLKKQAWRLFQNMSTGFDVKSEIIPKETLGITKNDDLKYIVRYVRRPVPIILEQMPDGLTIDGLSNPSGCELNPVLHMDILNKAVELAIATRGYNSQRVREANEKA